MDRAGILFFSRVFELCHATYEELLLALGSSIDTLFEEYRVGMPLVHAEADFTRPIRLHDRLAIELAVERLGKRSITFGYRIVGADDDALRATAKLVHAFVDLDGFEPTTAPDDFVAGLRQLNLLE